MTAINGYILHKMEEKERIGGNVLPVHLATSLSRIGMRMPIVHVTGFGHGVCKRRKGRVVVI